MATTNDSSKITLYGYFRSSCSARLRIALALKNLDFDSIPVNIKDDFHQQESYAKFNPSKSVPTLFVPGRKTPITQSLAGLEYLEEAYPDTPSLLPKDPFDRALVRSLVNVIVSDVQPVTNMKITRRITNYGDDAVKWSREFHAQGFEAYENLLKQTAGKYSFGDEVTQADVCLAPAVWNSERWGLDLEPYPTLRKVYENTSKVQAFIDGHWKNQDDCPESLR